MGRRFGEPKNEDDYNPLTTALRFIKIGGILLIIGVALIVLSYLV